MLDKRNQYECYPMTERKKTCSAASAALHCKKKQKGMSYYNVGSLFLKYSRENFKLVTSIRSHAFQSSTHFLLRDKLFTYGLRRLRRASEFIFQFYHECGFKLDSNFKVHYATSGV